MPHIPFGSCYVNGCGNTLLLFQQRKNFKMPCARKHIHHTGFFNTVASGNEFFQISDQSISGTGNTDDSVDIELDYLCQCISGYPAAGRIENQQIIFARYRFAQTFSCIADQKSAAV